MRYTTLFLCAAVLVFGACSATAQSTAMPPEDDEATMYATMIYTKGYVVGASLASSGLFRHETDTTWTHLGHVNPRVKALTYDPAHPDTLFIAASNGALRSYDGGESWRITTDWRVTEVMDVDLDPQNPQRVYIGTAYGVWRSYDQGATWQEANDGIPQGATYTEALETDRTTEDRVLAGTNDGIYVSTDGARTWTRTGGAGWEILDLQQSRSDPDVWLAATYQHGILRSQDNGQSWERVGPAATRDKSIHGVTIDPNDADHMAMAGWDMGVYVSDDGGEQWAARNEGLPTDDFYEIIFDANVSGRLWAATLEQGLYRSDDMGRTWTYDGLYGTLIFDLSFIYPANP
jgi:photosystem II stability/assembly factor-like uncharacterized protein